MTANVSQPTVKERTARNNKRPPRGERIRRRRMLALQRREEKAEVLTRRASDQTEGKA
jgi:hypothetical protein